MLHRNAFPEAASFEARAHPGANGNANVV